MKIKKQTITRFFKKGSEIRKTSYYLTEDGIQLFFVSVKDNILSESYNKNGNLEYIKTTDTLYNIVYNYNDTINYISMIRRDSDGNIIYDLIDKFIYNEEGKICTITRRLTNHITNSINEDNTDFVYKDNSITTIQGCITKKYTDARLELSNYAHCHIKFAYNKNNQPIRKTIISTDDNTIEECTYEYNNNNTTCKFKNSEGKLLYTEILNSDGKPMAAINPNGTLFYICQYSECGR